MLKYEVANIRKQYVQSPCGTRTVHSLPEYVGDLRPSVLEKYCKTNFYVLHADLENTDRVGHLFISFFVIFNSCQIPGENKQNITNTKRDLRDEYEPHSPNERPNIS